MSNEGEGDFAEDVSENGHDGTIDNPRWVDGKFRKALKFDSAGSGTFVILFLNDDLS